MIIIHLLYVRIHLRKNRIIRFPTRLELSHYKTLGVSERASQEEIKKAYRKMAIKHHPDKFAQMGEEHQKAAKEKFQKLQDAYETIKKERRMK